jgi:hypothetical protein
MLLGEFLNGGILEGKSEKVKGKRKSLRKVREGGKRQ